MIKQNIKNYSAGKNYPGNEQQKIPCCFRVGLLREQSKHVKKKPINSAVGINMKTLKKHLSFPKY